MTVLVSVLLAVPYFMMGGDSNLLPGFMKPSSTPKVKGVTSLGNAVTDKDVTVYQWTDEKGVKHFSNTEPQGKNVERLHLRSDANLIQAIKAPEKKKASRPKVTSIGSGMSNPYTPGGAKKLMNDAQNVQEVLNQRFEMQKKALNQR